MRHPAALRILALCLVLAGCSVITDFSPEKYLEQTEESCSDGADNDANGLADCADPACQKFDFCKEFTEARCVDKEDNDEDGFIDCKDADCCQFSHCAAEPSCGEQTSAACTDGIDNDNNGLTDCADFSCKVKDCCTRLVPIIAETFNAVSSSCQPQDCGSQPDKCCTDSTITWCNAFDPQRWVAWGQPRPRIEDGAFTPNQPCVKCPVSGLLSTAEVQLAPDLYLEFEADLGGDATALISVGLVDRLVVPQSGTCGGVQVAVPMLVGVRLSGSQVQAHLGGAAQATAEGKTSGKQLVAIKVARDGTVSFQLGDSEFFSSTVKLAPPYTAVRLLVQGHSTEALVDNLLLAQRRGCLDLDSWSSGPTGPGPVVAPSKDLTRFDAASATSPSALFDGTNYRIYYTGHCTSSKCTAQGAAIGLALSSDGQTWKPPTTALTIHGETSADVSDPAVSMFEGVYLMAYRAVASDGTPSIALATSDNGINWTHVKKALKPGGRKDWDGGDVKAPALAYFRNRFYLWYVGRSQASTIPSIGLAIAKDLGVKSTFGKHKHNPVLSPATKKSDDRGVADPWIYLEDGLLHLWYVGLTWGHGTTINYARSEDGLNWIRYPSNPLIRAGEAALFGGAEVRGPTVIDSWGRLMMWYSGQDPNGLPSIGHALNAAGSSE